MVTKPKGSLNFSAPQRGYALLIVIASVLVLSILLLMAKPFWETIIQRDKEEELIFRARQYVRAIEMYIKKHQNRYPQNLEDLYKEKFLRKLYKDPMTKSGKWDIVMRRRFRSTKTLMIVPQELLQQYISRANIIGVCSTSPETSFKEYRKKKRYNEWAIYLGEESDKEMPELQFVDREE